MQRQLANVHEREEPLAVLWAAEGGIYGRYGYGLATRNGRFDAERDRAGLGRADGPAQVRLVDDEGALAVLPAVYDRVRSVTPGFPSRTRAWWEQGVLDDRQEQRGGAGPLHRAVLELDGRPQAYALYRVKDESSEGFPASTLIVQEEVSASPAATREIWRFLFGVDLVARVRSRTMPPDHPLFLLAAEPARLRFRLGDGIFLRLVDVAAALEARSYGEGAVTIELVDRQCRWNEGRWALDAGADGAAVRRSRRSPELVLEARTLASAYLGGFSFGELVRAGLVEERRAGAAGRADAMFRTERAPWCPGFF
jgi:predicted acetyltransferase